MYAVFLFNNQWWNFIGCFMQSKEKLVTIVVSDSEVLFSIAATLRCREEMSLLYLDCPALPLMRTLWCWVQSKEISNTIFWVFGMTRPGIEFRSSGPLANTTQLAYGPVKWAIGLMSRVFANGSGDLASIQGRVIPKTLKMVLDAALLNTQHYKMRIKGKVEQSREWSSTLPYTSV